MDQAKLDELKRKLVADIDAWDGDLRVFSDIVRNALDLDRHVLAKLMREQSASYDEVRKWGSGAIVPPRFQRGEIVHVIRGMLTGDMTL